MYVRSSRDNIMQWHLGRKKSKGGKLNSEVSNLNFLSLAHCHCQVASNFPE